MKRSMMILSFFAVVILVSGSAWAQFVPSGFGAAQTTPRAYADADGDGICDITGQPVGQRQGQGQAQGKGKKYGPGDGSGNQGSGPRDGSGYGAGNGQGNGTCDGSGPKRNGSGSSGRGRGGRR